MMVEFRRIVEVFIKSLITQITQEFFNDSSAISVSSVV